MLRCYDSASKIFWFRGHKYDIAAMAAALDPLRQNSVLKQRGGEERLRSDLRLQNPDTLFDWEQYRSAVIDLVFADARAVRTIMSIHFRPYGKSAEIRLGPDDSFELDLPVVEIPGPKLQVKPVADAIFDAVARRTPPDPQA